MRFGAVLFLGLVLGCSRSASDEKASPSASPPPPRAPAPSAPTTASVAPPAPAAAEPDPAELGPAKRVVKGDGITITQLEDGRIALRTTSQWNEPLNQTFANCAYYRGAIPVLERQLVPERAKLLGKICRGK